MEETVLSERFLDTAGEWRCRNQHGYNNKKKTTSEEAHAEPSALDHFLETTKPAVAAPCLSKPQTRKEFDAPFFLESDLQDSFDDWRMYDSVPVPAAGSPPSEIQTQRKYEASFFPERDLQDSFDDGSMYDSVQESSLFTHSDQANPKGKLEKTLTMVPSVSPPLSDRDALSSGNRNRDREGERRDNKERRRRRRRRRDRNSGGASDSHWDDKGQKSHHGRERRRQSNAKHRDSSKEAQSDTDSDKKSRKIRERDTGKERRKRHTDSGAEGETRHTKLGAIEIKTWDEDNEKRRKRHREREQNRSPAPLIARTGGIYIPPHRMAQLMPDVKDRFSEAYQRLSWDALRKSVSGLINKVNATNIKNIIRELFAEDLIRGRGLLCRSCIKSQLAYPRLTDVFAALVAVTNTKFPEVGKLLLARIVLQLKRAYNRNDKPQLLAATKFIAHLVNQQVAHEVIALELLTVLLENPTDDSVEVAVGFVKECGALLQDITPHGLHGVFERFRGILQEGAIDKRVQFLMEGLFAIRKAKFQGFPAIRPELDLVEQEDQITHDISLDNELDPESSLDVFKTDQNFREDEKAYENLKRSILGDEASEDEGGSDEGGDDDNDEEEEEEEEEERMKISDETGTNLVNLRRTIYLTIMSSLDFEEAGHELLKLKLEPGQEMELNIMLIECCIQERTYVQFYGLLAEGLCRINQVYVKNFEWCFVQKYCVIHRLETNKIRNVAKFFAHLLEAGALPWDVLAYIRLTEQDTTSSSRIFIKILFQELSELMGIKKMDDLLRDPKMRHLLESIFPKNDPKNTKFCINFFTAIGLGGITETLREYFKSR